MNIQYDMVNIDDGILKMFNKFLLSIQIVIMNSLESVSFCKGVSFGLTLSGTVISQELKLAPHLSSMHLLLA